MGRFIRPARTAFRAVITVAMSGGLIAGCGASDSHKSVEPVGEVAAAEGGTKVAAPVVTEDGRMLKPEGYEGIWFETEPTDPWERLVWLSQKHIGDPVLLGQLGPGDAAEAFVGQPDICSEDLVARMEAMGLENVKGINGPGMYTCDFEFKLNPDDIFSALFSIEMLEITGESNLEVTEYSFGPGTSAVVRRVPGAEIDLNCVSVGSMGDDDSLALISSVLPLGSEGFEEACQRSYYLYWIFKNLGTLEGPSDHV